MESVVTLVEFRIFIAYASEDAAFAGKIKNSLSKIREFRPYLAVEYPILGENFKDRIQNAIQDSNFFIVILTKDGVASQWVNQELGYACAIRSKKIDFHIIPISSSEINLKGFITKDSDDLLLLDNYPDFAFIIGDIVLSIRNTIQNGEKEGIFSIEYTCPVCVDDKRFPLKSFGNILSSNNIIRSIEAGNHLAGYPCSNCGREINVNILTFEQSYTRVLDDPFSSKSFKRDPFR